MTEPRSYSVFFSVAAVHLLLLASAIYSSGELVQPAPLPDMQGVLVSEQSPASAPTPPQAAAPAPPPKPVAAPVPAPAPTPVSLPPVKGPPSERALTVAKAEPRDELPPKAPDSTPQPAAVRSAPPAPAREAPAARPAAQGAVAGETLALPRVEAGYQGNAKPKYPSLSNRLGEQGQVLLEVLVLTDGTVGEIRVKKSSGYPRLDNAALDTVRGWRFQPARRGSTPIAYRYTLPIDFSITK
jgi:periplasmic protein TonB